MRRPVAYALLGLAITILLLVAIREAFAPRLTLFLHDSLGVESDPVRADLSDALELRLYRSTRPHVGKIAALQKGLVLVHEGKPLIEEGYGFGFPIIESRGAAYISRHADTYVRQSGGRVSLVKAYRIDVVDRPTRPFRRKYADVPQIGRVVFTYTLRPPDAIEVVANFSDLRAEWDRAYLMNEQGAQAFTRYIAPDGRELEASEMGIWEQAQAPFGCWQAPDRQIRFCLETNAGQPGFVGRERYRQFNWLGFYTLSWSGIDLVVEPPTDTYTYVIRVLDGRADD